VPKPTMARKRKNQMSTKSNFKIGQLVKFYRNPGLDLPAQVLGKFGRVCGKIGPHEYLVLVGLRFVNAAYYHMRLIK